MNENSGLLDHSWSSRNGSSTDIHGDTSKLSPLAKSVILGGIDGIISSLCVICGCVGGNVEWKSLLIAGFSVIIANALNIGIGEYLSSQAHRRFVLAEERRLMWTFKQNPDLRIKLMSDVFESKGMTTNDAQVVVQKLSQYDSLFVSTMLTEELGLTHPEEDDAVLLLDSFVMLISFAGFGLVPLLSCCLVPLQLVDEDNVFSYTMLISAALLFFLGGLKATFKANFGSIAWSYSSFEVLFTGAVVGALAYVVGSFISSMF